MIPILYSLHSHSVALCFSLWGELQFRISDHVFLALSSGSFSFLGLLVFNSGCGSYSRIWKLIRESHSRPEFEDSALVMAQ